MKLNDVLSVISGGTKICIYVGCIAIFRGKMADASKEFWDENVKMFMDCEVIRINTSNGYITIAV